MRTCAYCGYRVPVDCPDAFCDIGCCTRWWRQKSTWWVVSVYDSKPPGPVAEPDEFFLAKIDELEKRPMTTVIRTILVGQLKVGDRMLLNDLRVLEVTKISTTMNDVNISYHSAAAKEHDVLTAPCTSKCRIIPGGWDVIDQALQDLI